MQPLPNTSKAWQILPADFLKKWEPSIKHTENKLSIVTEVDEPQNSPLVKPRRWNNLILNSKI